VLGFSDDIGGLRQPVERYMRVPIFVGYRKLLSVLAYVPKVVFATFKDDSKLLRNLTDLML
jgi:hypothetical protein